MNPSRTAGDRELPAAAGHKILPGRTVQAVNRVAVNVNYISHASNGTHLLCPELQAS